jgi:hypothetical protein
MGFDVRSTCTRLQMEQDYEPQLQLFPHEPAMLKRCDCSSMQQLICSRPLSTPEPRRLFRQA